MEFSRTPIDEIEHKKQSGPRTVPVVCITDQKIKRELVENLSSRKTRVLRKRDDTGDAKIGWLSSTIAHTEKIEISVRFNVKCLVNDSVDLPKFNRDI